MIFHCFVCRYKVLAVISLTKGGSQWYKHVKKELNDHSRIVSSLFVPKHIIMCFCTAIKEARIFISGCFFGYTSQPVFRSSSSLFILAVTLSPNDSSQRAFNQMGTSGDCGSTGIALFVFFGFCHGPRYVTAIVDSTIQPTQHIQRNLPEPLQHQRFRLCHHITQGCIDCFLNRAGGVFIRQTNGED